MKSCKTKEIMRRSYCFPAPSSKLFLRYLSIARRDMENLRNLRNEELELLKLLLPWLQRQEKKLKLGKQKQSWHHTDFQGTVLCVKMLIHLSFL